MPPPGNVKAPFEMALFFVRSSRDRGKNYQLKAAPSGFGYKPVKRERQLQTQFIASSIPRTQTCKLFASGKRMAQSKSTAG